MKCQNCGGETEKSVCFPGHASRKLDGWSYYYCVDEDCKWFRVPQYPRQSKKRKRLIDTDVVQVHKETGMI